jgi:hypothetical protein
MVASGHSTAMKFDLPRIALMQDSQNCAASVAGTPKSVRKERPRLEPSLSHTLLKLSIDKNITLQKGWWVGQILL